MPEPGAVKRRKALRLGLSFGRLSKGATIAWRVAIIQTILSAHLVTAVLAQDSRADQTQASGQSKSTGQTSPSMVTQAESAALKPVQLFDLLEKKSIVFPDIAANTVALSPFQKFQLFVDNSVSVHTVLWAGLGSAIGQAGDSPTGFGQGWNAYGKRFSSSLARESSGEFFGTFVLASALHQDPRFFPEHRPAFKQAVKYSLRRLFVTRNDLGVNVANVSGLVGPLLGEGLANAYWPDRNRTVGDTLFRYGLDVASRAAGNMFREYWPVVYAKMQHHVEVVPGEVHRK